ncbi:DUF3102 domain-containing protein [uncultured Oscillibacter sp.]|uniref:DUF3102 domain-containing protein n=1 Tax=uncultured Oscillibacter sp. TaxID=876091 RepID=UPI002626B16A|nr:DUF3102 domain-containing protein [uncultured Oscillibacter sp.]
MPKAFDISKYAATLNQSALAETRDIETITAEIIQLKHDAGNAIIGIGQRLIEAKAMLPHGEWLPWLEERVEYSERVAQKFMKLAREWSNPNTLSDLGASKALALLALPPEERETFMSENHLVDGEEKPVIDMTYKELEKAIRERDEARQAAEAAQADARSAEESRAKMEADMRALKEIRQSALEEAEQAAEDLLAAEKELEELRNRPVDVAIETVVDREAVEKARAEAVAEMQAKVDAAERQRKEAEQRRKDAEKALSDAKKEAGANAAILARAEKAEAELAEARRQLDAAVKAEKASVVNQNGDLAMFNVLFSQTQEQVNKMHGLRLKLGKADGELDGKLKAAINALADAVRRCAE